MRDIRPDLQERIDNIDKERRRLKGHLSDLDRQEAMYSDLLRAENIRLHQDNFFTAGKPLSEAHSPITQTALEAMADGADWSLDRLKAFAHDRGLKTDETSLGRSLHGALISLKRQGKVEQVARGVWRLARRRGAPTELSAGAPR